MVRKYNKIDNNFNLNTSNLKMSISLIRHIHGYNLITITVDVKAPIFLIVIVYPTIFFFYNSIYSVDCGYQFS